MNVDLKNLNRPEPVPLPADALSVKKGDDYPEIAKLLISGISVLIKDQFPTGLMILSELKKIVFDDDSESAFSEYRRQRSQFHETSNKLLVPVRKNRIALKKSPDIGWLKELYPEQSDFYLSFPDVQGLNSSWQWYKNGITYPGLKRKIHPFYGAYFPTRKDHLYLFDYWLRKYKGDRKIALDMGTGCGILAFQLLNKGFERVLVTDINPNSVLSAKLSAKSLGFDEQFNVIHSDLFENVDQKFDLIVFNPPWLPAENDITGLDGAIYFEPDLFSRFFGEAGDYLNDQGEIAFIFSNLGQKEGALEAHPVEEELENGRFKAVNQIRRKADKPSQKTKRRDHRRNEFVELWELVKR